MEEVGNYERVLTGIKSVIFNVYEGTILLVCGLYGVTLLINKIFQSKQISFKFVEKN